MFTRMTQPYDAAQRHTLAAALSEGKQPRCPACGGRIMVQAVPPPPEVSYVRHRMWVLCLDCRRTAAVDITADGPP
jgi:DNA-directed RNA polymerase subunit RPC12/RpoP